MGEHKEKDVPESEVSASEVVVAAGGGGSEKIEKAEVQGQGEEPVREEVGGEEGGSCNGGEGEGDIMVGVMGSDIYVDGVDIRDFGDGGGGNLSEERDKKGSGGGGGGGLVSEQGSKESEGSGEQASNLGIASDAIGSSGHVDAKEEGILEERKEVVQGDAVDEKSQQEAGVTRVEAQSLEVRSEVEVSSVAGGSTYVKTEVVVEKVAVFVSKETHDEGLEQNQTVENGVGGSSSAKTELVVEEKSSLVEETKEVDSNSGEALQESALENVGLLRDDVHNPGTEAVRATSSSIVEGSSIKTQADKDQAVEVPNNPGTDAVQSTISSSARESVPSEDGISNATSKSLDMQTQAADPGQAVSMDSEEIGYPSTEGMDTDAFNENFCFSVEELQATLGTANGHTENHYHAFADPKSSLQLAQDVGAEVATTENKMVLDSEMAKEAENGASLDQSIGGDSAQAQSNVEPEMGVDKQDKSVNSDPEGPKSSVKDQQFKHEELLDRSAATSPAQLDSKEAHGEELGVEEKRPEQKSEAQSANMNESADRNTYQLGSDAVQEIIVEETVSNAEQAGLHGGEIEVEERDGDAQPPKTMEEDSDKMEMEAEELDSDTQEPKAMEEDSDKMEMEAEELDSDTERSKTLEEDSVKRATQKSGSSVRAHYQLLPEDEVDYSVSNLVWGKVRSHPWWPAQIFDSSDASEKAMKYYKKDCYLVAYYGDRTFAWNDASLLKPFRSHFSQGEKQSNSEAFQHAVHCALEEVSRRVELGLACSCIPSDTFDKIKFQMVENAGIRQESSKRDGLDRSMSVNLFEPAKLVDYIKALAHYPGGGADELELVIAKSQLLAFYRTKGYTRLPEFQFCGTLLQNADALPSEDEVVQSKDGGQLSSGPETLRPQRSSYNKRKHNLKDGDYLRKRDRNVYELMGESWDSVEDEIASSAKKQKGSDSFADDSATPEGRKTISLAKVSTTTPVPKPSFKIGDCIRRVASQMTGAPSIPKLNSPKPDGSSEALIGDGSDVPLHQSEDAEIKGMAVPTDYSSLDDLLSQLHLAAENPLQGYTYSNIFISFFSDFRNSVIVDHHDIIAGKKRKASPSIGASPETFEFEDMSDTYWTDRVIQNGSEEQPARKSRRQDSIFVPVDLGKPIRRTNSRKRYSDVSQETPVEKLVDAKAPTELVMHFPVVDSVPSEISLNKMFRRFGPLKEAETEIDRDTNRARVVFKRCSDAEAAYSSAPKFNIFGSMVVNYQLNYTVSLPFKPMPVAPTHSEEDVNLFLDY